jgi:GAF domain-containing protein
MDNTHQQFEDCIKQVEDAETDDFFELANLAGLDPKKDFAGADFSYVNLAGCNLSDADLTHANLSNSDLRNADLRYANLSGANLSNANLQGTNQDTLDVEEKICALMNKTGYTPARQKSTDEGFGNNYNTPSSLFEFRRHIQEQTTNEIETFLALVQSHTECQLCSLFLIDDDGYLKCQGFYGFDSSGNKLTDKFFGDERYSDDSHKSAVAQAIKPGKYSRYGKSLLLNKDEIANSGYIDQDSRKYIEEICGKLACVIMTPVNGPNRSYGVLRIIKTENYSLFSSSSGFSHSYFRYLELGASQLAANLREINSSQKLAFISFMNRANLDLHGVMFQQSNMLSIYSLVIHKHLSDVIEHLAHSHESCVKAATLRLFSKANDGLVTVASSMQQSGHTKDTSIRRRSDNPKPLVIKVYEDGIDCAITDLQREIDPKSHSIYNLQNKDWLRKCRFKSLLCLAIKIHGKVVGTLVLYTGHKQVIANRDKAYFRLIADSLSLFLANAFSNNQDTASALDQFLDQSFKPSPAVEKEH